MASKIAQFQYTQKRRDQRLSRPSICVVIDGDSYATEDWSLGGVLIKAYSGNLEEDDEIIVEGIGPEGGEIFPIKVNAKVARLGPEKEMLAVVFSGIDEHVFDIMQGLMRRSAR